jgi:hypothetical protein
MKGLKACRRRWGLHRELYGSWELCWHACNGILEVRRMATLVIRNVEDELHARLKAQAAAHSHSMEEEARLLLRQGLAASLSDMPRTGFCAL